MLDGSTPRNGGDPGRGKQIVLVLGGGNALGAYHGGVAEVLAEVALRPDWLVGASIGGITAAILVGNPPGQGVDRLRQFWAEAAQASVPLLPDPTGRLRNSYNEAHALLSMLTGRPTIFRHRFPGLWSVLPGMPGDVALYDLEPLRHTLERLVDFRRLNEGETRLTLACVDLENGEEVYFDNRTQEIRAEHLLASAALSPLFPPVPIGGRIYSDPGYVNNLPLDRPFVEPPCHDQLVIAAELFNLRNHRPSALDAVLERTSDILFASHARRSIAALKREFSLRERIDPDGPTATLLHLAHRAPHHQRAGKSLDFSTASLAERWAAGRRDMVAGLEQLTRSPAGRQRFRYLPVEPDQSADTMRVMAGG